MINIFIVKGEVIVPAKKQIPREMILNSALNLLKKYGFEAVNVKRLAKELGCSTQPVYLSFSGMDELRASLIPLALKEFGDFMKNRSADGIIRLYDMSYIEFAKEEPHLFRFLFMRTNAFSETRKSLLSVIEISVKDFSKKLGISPEEADFLHDNLWMHAHGIAATIATEFCDWDMEKAARMLEESKTAFMKKYEA